MDPSVILSQLHSERVNKSSSQSRIVRICQEKNKCILSGLILILCFVQFYIAIVYQTPPQDSLIFQALKNLTGHV